MKLNIKAFAPPEAKDHGFDLLAYSEKLSRQ